MSRSEAFKYCKLFDCILHNNTTTLHSATKLGHRAKQHEERIRNTTEINILKEYLNVK